MKKSLLLMISFMLVFSSVLLTTAMVTADSTVTFDNPLAQFELEPGGTAHIIDYPDGSRTFVAKSPDESQDQYLNTYLLWDKSLGTWVDEETSNYDISDFTWEFDYAPVATAWNQDRFFFRDHGENEWTGYCLMIVGSNSASYGPWNRTDGKALIALRLGDDYANTASYAVVPLDLSSEATYHVKITCTGHQCQIWFYDKAGTAPTAATIDVTLPDTQPVVENETPYYEIYLPSGSFQIISWGGKFTVSNMTLAGTSAKPEPTATPTEAQATATPTSGEAPQTGDASAVMPVLLYAGAAAAMLLGLKKRAR